jgi:hypothetical protein
VRDVELSLAISSCSVGFPNLVLGVLAKGSDGVMASSLKGEQVLCHLLWGQLQHRLEDSWRLVKCPAILVAQFSDP